MIDADDAGENADAATDDAVTDDIVDDGTDDDMDRSDEDSRARAQLLTVYSALCGRCR